VYYLGLCGLIIRLNRRRWRILVYHGFEERESPFLASLQSNTTPRMFEQQMQFLRRHYNIVPLRRLTEGPPGSRLLAMTIDDGLASFLDGAFPTLSRLGLTACLAVTTDAIDNRCVLWMHELNALLCQVSSEVLASCSEFVPDATGKDTIRAAARRASPMLVEELLDHLRQACGPASGGSTTRLDLYLRWDDLRALSSAGYEIASHGTRHVAFSWKGRKEQLKEVQRSLAALREQGLRPRYFAYPFGDCTGVIEGNMDELDLKGILRVSGDPDATDLTGLPRTHVADYSPAELFTALEITPRLKQLRALLRRLLRAGRR